MRLRIEFFILLILWLPTSGCSGPERLKADWAEFKAADGSYSALFPGPAVEKHQKVDAPGGGRETQSLTAMVGPGTFKVLVVTFPDGFVIEPGPPDLLLGISEADRRGIDKNVVTQSSTMIAGHPAIAYVVEDKEGKPVKVHQGRLVQVDSRLYDIAVEAPAKTVHPDDVAKFLDSFKLLNP